VEGSLQKLLFLDGAEAGVAGVLGKRNAAGNAEDFVIGLSFP
jgi:hypothetical protein